MGVRRAAVAEAAGGGKAGGLGAAPDAEMRSLPSLVSCFVDGVRSACLGRHPPRRRAAVGPSRSRLGFRCDRVGLPPAPPRHADRDRSKMAADDDSPPPSCPMGFLEQVAPRWGRPPAAEGAEMLRLSSFLSLLHRHVFLGGLEKRRCQKETQALHLGGKKQKS